ncbi:hypothetical protein ACIQ34_19010 [Ureibacillus sp. NPDC094379]
MKNGLLSILAIIMIFTLAACGKAEESNNSTSSENQEATKEVTANENTEVKNSETGELESEEADVIEVSANSEDTEVQKSENLLDNNKVFEYENESVVLTLEQAQFTTKFSASNADPNDTWATREAPSDSDIYLHLTGTIKNDTTDSVSFGNALGFINFSLLYDGKHEFTNTSSAEEENGTKFGPSGIDALTEGKIHVYFQVPKPVSETDKPLVLTVLIGEEPYEIKLR